MMNPSLLQVLFERYVQKTASQHEEQAFLDAAAQEENQEELKQLLEAHFHATAPVHSVGPVAAQEILEAIYHTDQYFIESKETNRQRRIVSFPWYKWAAAAAILLAITTIVLYTRHQKEPHETNQLAHTKILPGSNKATLTLADGSTVVLDSATNNTITDKNGIQIINLNNAQLAYNKSDILHHTSETSFNVLTTPRGGQYQVVLPDGSHVWLNSASSLRYPTAFTGSSREVTLTGEGYFEITPNMKQPFYVNAGEVNVQVLGTSFNIMAYAEEAAVKTTLATGAVKLFENNTPSATSNIQHTITLTPGQQASLAGGQEAFTIGRPDMEAVLAWKNGLFNFQGLPFEVVMRQLARWYNIEVVYEKGVPDIQFEGELGRDVELSKLLNFLERANVHFRMEEGRKLVITGS